MPASDFLYSDFCILTPDFGILQLCALFSWAHQSRQYDRYIV